MRRLRRAHRRPTLILTAVVVGTYMLNVLMANLVPGVMSVSVLGPIGVGLLLMLLQSGATVWAAWWFERYAKAALDPLAESLKSSIDRAEGG